MHEPLSIALLTHSVNPRGGVVHTLELADALQAAGHHVTIVAAARPAQTLFRKTRADVEIVTLPDAPCEDMVLEIGTRIAAIEWHVERLQRSGAFDIWHAQDPISGNALANLRARGRIPHFVRTVHHLDHFDQPQLAAWQERGFRAADQVLCVSPIWQEHLSREHGLTCGLVHNGVDTRRFTSVPDAFDPILRRELGLRDGHRIVLSIGGIEERKNSVRLLEAFIALRERYPELQLVVAGGASLLDHSRCQRAFHQKLAEHAISPGPMQPVIVTGPLPDEHIAALLRIADVTAMPSVREGFGLIVLESIVSGTPVVVSRIRPFTDYLRPLDAWWADPLDSESIAEALEGALTRYSAEQVRISAARLSAQYDWRSSARQHLAHYSALLRTAEQTA